MNTTRKLCYLSATLVAIVTFIAFLPALQGEFTGDDFSYVMHNTFIRSIDIELFKSAFLSFQIANWHPLTWISHALDYAIWGANPLGHHLTNIIIHALNAFLVVLLAARLIKIANTPSPIPSPSRGGGNNIFPPLTGGDERKGEKTNSRLTPHNSSASADPPGAGDSRFLLIAAATTGLFFGLHPMRVEAVAWVAERKELLCGLFFLLSLMAYMSYRSNTTYRTYVLSLGFFILALMSKPMAVTLPFVLLILDWYPFKRIHSLRTFLGVFVEKIPFIALSLISSVLTILAQEDGGTIISMEAIPLSTRLLVGAKCPFAYLWKMILPLHLMPAGYPYPNQKDVSILSLEYLLWIVLLTGITVTCVVIAKKQRLWLSVWMYYIVTLVPVIGIVKAGGMFMADRYSYLPSLGPSLVAGVMTAGIQRRIMSIKRRRLLFEIAAVVASIALLTSLSLITREQIGLWKNDKARMNYLNRIRQEEAMEKFNKARAHYDLGTGFEKEGLQDKAIEEYLTALSIYPTYVDAHFSLGNAYLKSGLPDKAIEHFQILVKVFPGEAPFRTALGFAYAQRGFTDRAIEQFTAAVGLAPANPYYQENLRRASEMKDHVDTGMKNKSSARKE